MSVIQPRPTHILYQCAKLGDDRTSFKKLSVQFLRFDLLLHKELSQHKFSNSGITK